MKTKALLLALSFLLGLSYHSSFAQGSTTSPIYLNYGSKKLQIMPHDYTAAVPWGPSNNASGATQVSDGKVNTQTIFNKYGIWHNGNYAAGICNRLNAYGHNDWYLPSYLEMLFLFQNKETLTGFKNSLYWSSTDETWGAEARVVDFGSGIALFKEKSSPANVRCIRIESIEDETFDYDIFDEERPEFHSTDFLSSFIDPFYLTDNQLGQIITMWSVAGLTSGGIKYERTGVDNLRRFDTRKNTYKSVLRTIAFQNEFDASNFTGFYSFNSMPVEFTDEIVGFWANFTLSFSEYAIDLAKEIKIEHAADYLKSAGSYTNAINHLNEHSSAFVALDHLSTAFSFLSIVTNAVSIKNDAAYIAASTNLLQAASVDMGLLRLNKLKSLNIINDKAFTEALDEVIEELENIPEDYWQKMFYSISTNQDRLLNATISFAQIATTVVASIAKYNPGFSWVGAYFFGLKQLYLIRDWQVSFRELTCAATIYANLYGIQNRGDFGLVDEDISDYTQVLFFYGMRNVLSNNYMKAWEFFRPDNREVRLFFTEWHDSIYERIKYKRINRFKNLLFTPADAGKLGGSVVDAVTGQGLQDVDITVKTGDRIIRSFTSSENGTYEIALPEAENYTLEFHKTEYLPIVYNNISIRKTETTHMETMMQINERYSGIGSISGRIIHAFSGDGVPYVDLLVREGVNNRTGNIVRQTKSNSQGDYNMQDIQAGNYTVEAAKDDFITSYFTAISIGNQNRQNQNIPLTPKLSSDVLRIVLDWGVSPQDLDSHITGPRPNSSRRFHVYFRDKEFKYNNTLHTALDLDVTKSYGPETVTIYRITPGAYRYSVHDYTNRRLSNSYALSRSGAKVRLYMGSQLIQTFHVPSNKGGTLWTVFEFDGERIIPVNTMSYERNDQNVY